MANKPRHSWDLSPGEAIELQQQLRSRVKTRRDLRINQLKTIAGVDCAFDRTGRYGYAGVVVYSYPDLVEVQRVEAQQVAFPYVPGLLSFREAPLILAAFEKLKKLPDVVVVDGHGLAHPRRFGIASHLGLLIDRPTIGCAKSRLIGEHRMPAQKPGSTAALEHEGEHIGNVLRTKRGVKPVFISVGHRMDLATATRIMMKCVDKYRIPKPTRDADIYVARVKAQHQ